MNICFKSLKIHNFMSFNDAEINLDNQGYTLVSGTNNYKLDSAKSNGSGKSSIWESIVWALTGTTIRGTKDIINKFANDGTFVELQFNIDDIKYKIIRYKEYSNIGTNLKIYINDVDKSGKGIRDTETLLEQYLPDITSDLIGSVIILGQGLPQRFTNNTPSGRKEVLEKLSKSDYLIDDLKNKLTKRKIELSENLREKEDAILSDNSKLSVYNKQLIKYNEDLKNFSDPDDIRADIIALERIKTDIQYKINILTNDFNQREEAYNKELNEYQHWLTVLNDNIQSEQVHIEQNYNTHSKSIEVEQLKLQIKSQKEEIAKLDAVKDVCPTCGQKLPDVHKIDTTEQKDTVKRLEAILIEKTKQLQEIENQKQTKIDEMHKTFNKQTNEIKNNVDALKQEFDNVANDLKAKEKELNDIQSQLSKLELEWENFNSQYEPLMLNIKSTEDAIKQLSEEILYNNNEKDNIKSHFDIVNKMLTIATRDFRGFLLSEVINFINQKAKEYCKEIFDSEEVEFKLDGNNIFIGYCGKQYENLSGGEKQKIDLIIQFSIRDMLSQFLNFSSNILVLDEICDNLDYIGCQKVMNLISTKLSDISSLFIITHHSDELAIPYDNELMIIKDENGISKLG